MDPAIILCRKGMFYKSRLTEIFQLEFHQMKGDGSLELGQYAPTPSLLPWAHIHTFVLPYKVSKAGMAKGQPALMAEKFDYCPSQSSP